MALPRLNQDVTALTGVQYTQDLSENFSVFFGKLNLLDGTPAAYARGMRLNYFWNAAMQWNLAGPICSPARWGPALQSGMMSSRCSTSIYWIPITLPTTSGFSTLFGTGWWPMENTGRGPTGLIFRDIARSDFCIPATRTALDSNPYLLLQLVLSGESLPKKDSAWTATYHLDQVLYADAEDPTRNWTLNSDLGLTDGNPNPIHWFANVSLVGNSPIRSRDNDTIGIGYYHLGVSNLADSLDPRVRCGERRGTVLQRGRHPLVPCDAGPTDSRSRSAPHRTGPSCRHQGQAVFLISQPQV